MTKIVFFFAVVSVKLLFLDAFAQIIHSKHRKIWPLFATRRYGPPTGDNFSDSQPSANSLEQRLRYQTTEFQQLVTKVRRTNDPQHIPSLLTKQMDFLLELSPYALGTVVNATLDLLQEEEDQDTREKSEEAIELILSFLEDFVEQANRMDDQNKKLLGNIIKLLSKKEMSSKDREDALDQLMRDEKEKFTPGFLRHIEGECNRIASAKKLTPESTRLIQILRLIQTRVLEELGNDLGEAAQVLGQLIGYESKTERLAVLEAGLTVQGIDFAQEMKMLTEEALEGFQRVPGGADPGLITCIKEIDQRLAEYIRQNESFQ